MARRRGAGHPRSVPVNLHANGSATQLPLTKWSNIYWSLEGTALRWDRLGGGTSRVFSKLFTSIQAILRPHLPGTGAAGAAKRRRGAAHGSQELPRQVRPSSGPAFSFLGVGFAKPYLDS